MTTCPACGALTPHEAHQEEPDAWCPVAFASSVQRDLDRLPVVSE